MSKILIFKNACNSLKKKTNNRTEIMFINLSLLIYQSTLILMPTQYWDFWTYMFVHFALVRHRQHSWGYEFLSLKYFIPS